MLLQRQRGAIAVSAAIAMLASLLALGFALDLGRLYYAKRDLQRIANLAAMDSARVVGGCMGPVANPAQLALAEASASVLRNQGQAAWVAAGSVDVGRMATNAGVRYFDSADNPQRRAVRVRLSREAPARLIPIFNPPSTVNLQVEAAALSAPYAVVHVGSKALSIDPPPAAPINVLFSGLFGNPLNVDVLTYEAFFAETVEIQPLLDELSLGAPGTDLTDPPVPSDSLLNALLSQLSPAVAALVSQLSDALAGTNVVPSEVLGIVEPVADATISLADLIGGVARRNPNGSLVGLPLPLPLGPGETDIDLINPGDPVSLTPGGTEDGDVNNYAHNAQAVVQSSIPLQINVPGLPSLNSELNFFVQAAQATAEVVAIHCADHTNPVSTADIAAQSNLVRIGIGRFGDINAANLDPEPVTVIDVEVPLSLGLPGIPSTLVRAQVTAISVVELGDQESTVFEGMRVKEHARVGTPSATAIARAIADIPSQLVVTSRIELVGSDLTGAITPVFNVLKPGLEAQLQTAVSGVIGNALSQTFDPVLSPQLNALGVTVGGADVTLNGIKADQPVLFVR